MGVDSAPRRTRPTGRTRGTLFVTSKFPFWEPAILNCARLLASAGPRCYALSRAITRHYAPLRAVMCWTWTRDFCDAERDAERRWQAGLTWQKLVTGATRERGASASSRAATLEAVVRAVRSGVKDSGSLGRQYRVSVGSLGTIEKKH